MSQMLSFYDIFPPVQGEEIQNRIRNSDFAEATFLQLKNIMRAIEKSHSKKARSFFIQPLSHQRRTMVEMMKKQNEDNNISWCKDVYEVFKNIAFEEYFNPIEDPVIRKRKEICYITSGLSIKPGICTTSPWIIGHMVNEFIENLNKNSKVMEVGLGLGYHASILTRIFESDLEIDSFEINSEIYEIGKENVSNFDNVNPINEDAYLSTRIKSESYDGVYSTAGVRQPPEKWETALKEGGILVVPRMLKKKEFERVLRHSVQEQYFTLEERKDYYRNDSYDNAYRGYQTNKWNHCLALSKYRKKNDELENINNVYDFFFVPIYEEETEPTFSQLEKDYSIKEEELIEHVSKWKNDE